MELEPECSSGPTLDVGLGCPRPFVGDQTMVQRIHPSAVIDPQANLASDVEIGPFCDIEAGVTIGSGSRLGARVSVKEGTQLGERNEVFEGVVLGGRPQHLQANGDFGPLLIGQGNTIRENVTIHRGLKHDSSTKLGDGNLVMVNAHIAHDCQVGNHTIIANNVMMAGHVSIDDYAYLSGAVGIHQFCRVGSYAMVGGQAHIKQDVPPFVTVDGQSSRIVGLNLIGLKRRGFDKDAILQLKAAYRVIYRQGLTWNEVLSTLERDFTTGPASTLYGFLSGGKRGFISERRTPAAATVQVPQLKTVPEAVDQRRVG
jgi:UDP-N-acetylglucosamine acyltransferase